MNTLLWLVIIAAVVVAGFFYLRFRKATSARSLKDEQAEARRWVERLGGGLFVGAEKRCGSSAGTR